MIGPRIGYALLLLAALGLDLFCGSVWTLALTLLLVLTPLGCIPLHLWAVKQIRLRLDAPVNLGKGETGTLRVQIENKTALPHKTMCRSAVVYFAMPMRFLKPSHRATTRSRGRK